MREQYVNVKRTRPLLNALDGFFDRLNAELYSFSIISCIQISAYWVSSRISSGRMDKKRESALNRSPFAFEISHRIRCFSPDAGR